MYRAPLPAVPRVELENGVAKSYDERWLIVPDLDVVTPERKSYSTWDDLRDCAKDYTARCRSRLMRKIPPSGDNILDVGSGPILYKEYVEYSSNFRKRYCVDLSAVALEEAKRKIGDHGVFLHGSLFDVPLESNFFDCTLCILTLFNIHEDLQEAAVCKLIEVTKPGKPVIIVYCNPTPTSRLSRRFLRKRFSEFSKGSRKRLKQIGLRVGKRSPKQKAPTVRPQHYYYRHPTEWWDRFSGLADLEILPWAYFEPGAQKALIPDNKLGKLLLDGLFLVENRFSHFLGKRCAYSVIVLTKQPSGQ